MKWQTWFTRTRRNSDLDSVNQQLDAPPLAVVAGLLTVAVLVALNL